MLSFGTMALAWVACLALARALGAPSTRLSALLASALWAAALVLLTEVLSAAGCLTRGWLKAGWLVTASAIAVLTAVTRRRRVSALPRPAEDGASSAVEFIAEVFVVFQIATLGLVAGSYLSSNWDSMTYHLARVLHWEQNHSVAHFATGNDRQNYFPPFAEYAALHFRLLSTHEESENFVQWLAMIGCVLGVAEVARGFGLRRGGQRAAQLLCASIPMGVLQASSTQNDYVEGFWLVCLAALVMAWWNAPDDPLFLVGSSLALGFALLTKGTGFVLAPGFAILLVSRLGWRLGRAALPRLALVAALVIAVNAAHWWRNVRTYGTLTGTSYALINDELSGAILASNVIRNLAIHTRFDDTIPLLRQAASGAAAWLELAHGLTGRSPTDRGTTQGPRENPFRLSASYSEDNSANFLHLVLGIGAAFALLTGRGQMRGARPWAHAAATAFGFLSFCAVLRWQLFNSRLQLPLFVLWTPVIAAAGSTDGRPTRAAWTVFLLVAAASLPWTFRNASRPIPVPDALQVLPRFEWSAGDQAFRGACRQVAEAITRHSCDTVGLKLRRNTREVPLWSFLRGLGFRGTLRHVRVDGPSRRYEAGNPPVCAVVSEFDLGDLSDGTSIYAAPFHVYLVGPTAAP